MNPLASRDRDLLPALFLVALATVMFEVLPTRIFSLTLWYHFAFMAISIAMFGLTVGALLVLLRPQWWPQETLPRAMATCRFCWRQPWWARFSRIPLPTCRRRVSCSFAAAGRAGDRALLRSAQFA